MLSLSQLTTKVCFVSAATSAVKPASSMVRTRSLIVASKAALQAVFLATLMWKVSQGVSALTHTRWPVWRANEKLSRPHSQRSSSGLASNIHQVTRRRHAQVWARFNAIASFCWKDRLKVLVYNEHVARLAELGHF